MYFETDKYNIPETEHNRLILFLSKLLNLILIKFRFTDFVMIEAVKIITRLYQRSEQKLLKMFSTNEINSNLITNVDEKEKFY